MNKIESLLEIWSRPKINWRRKFKWILKEVCRHDISHWEFQAFLCKVGIYGSHYDFVYFLQTCVKGRTFGRIYKAAQKKEMILPMVGFLKYRDKDFRKINFMLKDNKFIYSAEVKRIEIKVIEDKPTISGASFFSPLKSVFSFRESGSLCDTNFGIFFSLNHIEETIKEKFANNKVKCMTFSVYEQEFGLDTLPKEAATIEFYPESGECHTQPVLL